jgi:tripartite-type tricarboxylate transporter receptor subunit TctC
LFNIFFIEEDCMKKFIVILLTLLLATPVLFAAGGKEAAKPAYPQKPIQVVVPAGAGGDTDINCRILAKYLEKELGQSVVTVNVGGAGGTLGTRKVKDAAPDGYTALFFHPGMLLNKILGLADYSFQDFEVAALAVLDETNIFAANGKAPYNTMAELAKILKEKPKSLSFATEIGSFTHLHVLAFQDVAGVQFNIVDVGGAAAKTAALKGQQIDVIGTQYGLVKDYIKTGDFKAIGVLSDKRNPAFPDVPTFKELGFDVSFTKFFFYSFPKGTPKEIVDRFSAAVKKVVENPEYQKAAFDALYVTPTYMGPKETFDFLTQQETMYKKYLSGIQMKQ